jgi:ferritin-like metal-binding protein YciE
MLAENLSDIFQRGLELSYDCQDQLIHELPKVIESVSSGALKVALGHELVENKQQLERLEQVFALLNRAPASESDGAIDSILGEAEKLIKHIEASPLRDAAVIIAGNLVHHNKIAQYGSLCALARVLALPDAERILGLTLIEERAADEKLVQIAATVNQEAAGYQQKPHGFAII